MVGDGELKKKHTVPAEQVAGLEHDPYLLVWYIYWRVASGCES
jgi:hypothetical protein